MPSPRSPVAALPASPRIPDALVGDAGDVDPQFPDLDGLDLDGVDLSYPDARTITVLRSRLASCAFAVGDASLDAQDARFVDVDLSGRRIEGLTRVSFERCRLTGADFGEARLHDVEFSDCALDLASMRVAMLERVRISGGRADEVDLSGSRLTDVTLDGLRVSDLGLGNTRLERVDLTESDVSEVVDLAELRGTILSATQAVALAVRLARVAGIHVAVDPD